MDCAFPWSGPTLNGYFSIRVGEDNQLRVDSASVAVGRRPLGAGSGGPDALRVSANGNVLCEDGFSVDHQPDPRDPNLDYSGIRLPFTWEVGCPMPAGMPGDTPLVLELLESGEVVSSACLVAKGDGTFEEDTTPPQVTCPASQQLECSGSRSATATYAAEVTDECSVGLTPTCGPESGTRFPLGSTGVTCTATDDGGNRGDCMLSVVVADTTEPSITCPAPQTVECMGSERAAISFQATASDTCWGSLSTSCAPISGSSFALGDTTVACSTRDGAGLEDSCGVKMSVVDTTDPEITCPEPQTVECTGNGQAVVAFQAAASDTCWGGLSTSCAPISGSSFALGDTTVTCSAEDGSGRDTTCAARMSVVDTTPPEISSVAVSKRVLWPPNNGLHDVDVVTVAADVCDGTLTCEVVSVASDEPDSGLSNGDPPGDAAIVDSDTVRLRAQRAGTGDGRVYTITVECRDDTGANAGNAVRRTVEVSVPHDRS
jgi:hypothetical protein